MSDVVEEVKARSSYMQTDVDTDLSNLAPIPKCSKSYNRPRHNHRLSSSVLNMNTCAYRCFLWTFWFVLWSAKLHIDIDIDFEYPILHERILKYVHKIELFHISAPQSRMYTVFACWTNVRAFLHVYAKSASLVVSVFHFWKVICSLDAS